MGTRIHRRATGMTKMTAAKWKVRALLIPCFIILSPLLIVIFGIATLLMHIPEFLAEEYRWAKLVDDYNAKQSSDDK